VCVSLCTTVIHNIAQHRTVLIIFPPNLHSPDNHHSYEGRDFSIAVVNEDRMKRVTGWDQRDFASFDALSKRKYTHYISS